MSAAPARRRLHYAWVVVGVVFLAMLVSAGFRSTVGVFLVPLEEEFGWGRDDLSLAIALSLLAYGLVAPFAAAMVERAGARTVMTLALGVVAGGSALTVGMSALWQLDLVWGVAIGLATGSVSIPLSAIVATRWFVRRRGLVTGLLAASFATGNLVFLPLLAWLADRHGWRWSAALVALTAAVVIPVVLVFMRERPADVGLLPFGATVAPPLPQRPPAGIVRGPVAVLAEAARVRDFWLLAGTFFVCGWTTNGAVQTHFIPAAHDHRIPAVTAAGILAIIGVFDIVGSTASGWLTDRADPRRLLFAYYTLRGISLAFLPFVLSAPRGALVAFAVLYGLDWVATIPPTVALTNRVFGPARAGVVFGWIFCAHMVGGAAAAWVAGAFRTAFGSYLVAFTGGGLLAIAAGVASLGIARSPRPGAGAVVATGRA